MTDKIWENLLLNVIWVQAQIFEVARGRVLPLELPLKGQNLLTSKPRLPDREKKPPKMDDEVPGELNEREELGELTYE